MREEIEVRPSASIFIGLILGLIALNWLWAVVLFIGFFVWVRGLGRRFLLGGSFLAGLAFSPTPAAMLQVAEPLHGVGTISSVPVLYSDAQVCEVSAGGRHLVLTLPRDPPAMLGDEIRVSGIAKPLDVVRTRFRPYESVQGKIRLERFEIVREGSWIAHLADGWRRSFMAFLGQNLSPKSASLVDALCFNSRSMLDTATRREMAESGTVHMVSASGLQVFILGALLALFIRLFPLPRVVQISLLASLLAVYCLAAGLQPQIVRAALVTLFGLTAYLVRRDPDALSALALSGVAYLLWRPEAVYELAFQLSFVTVGCIALFFRRSPSRSAGVKDDLTRWGRDFLRVSGVILLATTPLIAYYLGVVSVVSVFANLLVFWCLPLIVGIAFVSHASWLVAPPLGEAIASRLLASLAHWIFGVLDRLGDGSWTLQVPGFSPLWLVAFYGAWLMTYRRRIVRP